MSDELLHYNIFGRNRKDQHVILATQQFTKSLPVILKKHGLCTIPFLS